MTSETHLIAARLAAASQAFPIHHGDRASRADVTAEGDVITVVVTEHYGRGKREYRAEVRLVGIVPEAAEAGGAP
jgi:hypothetical protein